MKLWDIVVAALLLFILAACDSPVPTPPEPVDGLKVGDYYTGYKKGFQGPGLIQGAPFEIVQSVPQLPKRFDWVSAGYATPVRNQGGCGSCWAFGTTQALEAAVNIFDGKQYDLAEQELVANLYYGCGGGDFAADWLTQKGLVFESDCPYTASNRQCPGGIPKSFVAKASGWGNIGQSNRAPTVDEIKAAIYQYGPIPVTVAATSGFSNYHGGVMSSCGGTSINHIVALVGWDGAGNWVMKNSWGTSWGQNGYATVPYGCNSIAQDAAFIRYSPLPAYSRIGG